MKIRRITLAALLILTLLFLVDVKYSHTFQRMRWGMSLGVDFEINEDQGSAAEKVQEFTNFKGEIATLTVHNLGGEIVLEPSTGDEITVTAVLKATGSNEEEAARKLAQWEVTEKKEGNSLSYQLSGVLSPNEKRETEVAYLLRIPAGLQITLNQDYGNVKAARVAGEIVLEARFATVEVSEFTGELDIESNFSTLNLSKIAGPVTLNDSYSTVRLDLLEIEEGYNFDVELKFASLSGSIPEILEVVNEGNTVTAKGSLKNGVNQVNLRSKFSSITLNLVN